MSTEITREQLISEARSWLGTPFHHQGRVKGAGVDCVGVLVKTLSIFNLLTVDNTNYSRNPNGDYLIRMCELYFNPIPMDEILPGDILVFAWGKEPQHLALYTDIGILHAHVRVKKVVEHIYDDPWKKRTVAAYRIKGIK